MELNFNSVENSPNLNAKAAFFSPSLEQLKGQVDSGKVFKEDIDIVPTVIDDTLSYMPWGGDKAMPYNILKPIEDDETLSPCQMLNAHDLRLRHAVGSHIRSTAKPKIYCTRYIRDL